MAVQRKTHHNSTAGGVDAFEAAAKPAPLQWPAGVSLPKNAADRKLALALFDDIQRGRSRDHWLPNHPRLIASLCKCEIQIARAEEALAEGELVLVNAKGWGSRNPLLDVLGALYSQRGMAIKSLGLMGQVAELDNAGRKERDAKNATSGKGDVATEAAASLLAGYDPAAGETQH